MMSARPGSTRLASAIADVRDVSGSKVSAELDPEAPLGLRFVEGEGYRVGQPGSFVKIPVGFKNLYGVVAQVGASAVPVTEMEESAHLAQGRWLTIELIGESTRAGSFELGISQYPTIGDKVHLVTRDDLGNIYGRSSGGRYIELGKVASSEGNLALVDVNLLVSRHSLIVGSTGSGKSTCVASLVSSVTDPNRFPSARVLVVDVHGEYSAALEDRALTFKVGANEGSDERELAIPYWALELEEFISVAFGKPLGNTERAALADKIVDLKRSALEGLPVLEMDPNTVTADSPVPFSVHRLWFEMYCEVAANHLQTGNQSLSTLAFELDEDGNAIDEGSALEVRPPRTMRQNQAANADPKVYLSQSPLNMRRPIEVLGSRLRDSRYNFLFRPQEWLPSLNGSIEEDLDEVLQAWLAGECPISILNLSDIPREIIDTVVGVILRITYNSLSWARFLDSGARERPALVVLEEAHAYLANPEGNAGRISSKIVKEGRKYGVGLMMVSQRPTEIPAGIRSQCGTLLSFRLSNSNDRSAVESTASQNLSGLFSLLPSLRTGEGIAVGQAVQMPLRFVVAPPKPEKAVASEDPQVFEPELPGGWNKGRENSGFESVVRVWRCQNARDPEVIGDSAMVDRVPVDSSNLASVGYNDEEGYLEIEFHGGRVYRYFDVPRPVYEGLMAASSKGKYFHAQIRGVFRYARM